MTHVRRNRIQVDAFSGQGKLTRRRKELRERTREKNKKTKKQKTWRVKNLAARHIDVSSFIIKNEVTHRISVSAGRSETRSNSLSCRSPPPALPDVVRISENRVKRKGWRTPGVSLPNQRANEACRYRHARTAFCHPPRKRVTGRWPPSTTSD